MSKDFGDEHIEFLILFDCLDIVALSELNSVDDILGFHLSVNIERKVGRFNEITKINSIVLSIFKVADQIILDLFVANSSNSGLLCDLSNIGIVGLINGCNLFGSIFIDFLDVVKTGATRLKNACSLGIGLRNDILGISLLNGLSGGECLSFSDRVALMDLIEAFFYLRDDRFGLRGG